MTTYRFGPFRLDKEQLLLSVEGSPLALGPKVVETLLALIEHPGEVLGKAELLDRIWPEGFVEEANLAQNIYVLRKTLRSHWDADTIATVPRRGYRFAAPVSVLATDSARATPAAASTWRGRSRLLALATLAAAVVLAFGLRPFVEARSTSISVRPGLSADGARLYAMGRFYWNQRTPDGVSKSIRYFQDVIASDPRDARGYAALAAAYAVEGDYQYGPLSKKQAFARAEDYARQALAVDRNSSEAHAALGLAELDTMRRATAEREFRRAIALNAASAPAHQWYGIALLMDGKGADAFTELHKASDLDPESVAATDWLSEAAYMARRYTDAVNYARQTLDLSPHRYSAYTTLGLAYEALGEYKAAIGAFNTFAASCPDCREKAAPYLAHVYASSRDLAAAQAELHLAQSGVASRRVDLADFITALVGMGRRSEALAVLRTTKKDDYSILAIDPRMDPVRDDARFRRYIEPAG